MKNLIKTMLYIKEGFNVVKYHNTEIFKQKENQIILNSDGWKTKTTKQRINEAFNFFNIPLALYQNKNEWYILNLNNKQVLKYFDNIIINY